MPPIIPEGDTDVSTEDALESAAATDMLKIAGGRCEVNSDSSTHPLVRMWHTFRDNERPVPGGIPLPDHLQNGVDYLSLVSNDDFERFIEAQLANDEVRAKIGFGDVIGWLTSASSNKPSAALKIRDLPQHRLLKLPIFLDRLRSSIWKGLSDLIENVHAGGLLPDSGSVLYFTEQLTHCYIVSYHLHYDRPVIEILDRIDSPRGIAQLEAFPNLRTHRARNRAKNYLTSGQKFIVQNGVTTHVDRRLDKSVFGPTIDTLLLADILVHDQKISEVRSFLEIGCGNGHITSTIAGVYPNLSSLVAYDINEYATACTVRNVRANLRYLKKSTPDCLEDFMVACSKFTGNDLKQKFDLVVCNPPYVSHPPADVENFAENFGDAVGGTSLIETILANLSELLNPRGRLLLMVSSVTQIKVEDHLPAEFVVAPSPDHPSGLSVPFEVEQVLDQRDWIDHLKGRESVATDPAGRYTHTLLPLWIERRQ